MAVTLSSGGVSSLHLTLGPLLELCLGSHLWTLYDAQVPDALLDDWLWVAICPTFITLMKVKVLVALSCLIFCSSMDCSPPGFSVHGILQARIQKWLPFPSPRDLPDPGIEPTSSALRWILYCLSHQGNAIYNFYRAPQILESPLF